ncbi:MAG: AAA family ATPase [bacterium]
MLKRLRIQGFKSLNEVDVEFPRLTVLFGANTAGKSNLLEAIQAVSRLACGRTLLEALANPIRGNPIECFAFPSGGLSELYEKDTAEFTLEADLGKNGSASPPNYRYRIAVQIHPRSGKLSVRDEYLAKLTRSGAARGSPLIEEVEGQLHIRRQRKPAHPRIEKLGLNHTQLSDIRFSGSEYEAIQWVREELSDFRIYYLDPRVAMRNSVPPKEVADIGTRGEDLAPFLYRVQLGEPKAFQLVMRSLRMIIPSLESVSVELDEKRGALDLQIIQNGITFSSRIISEGTLRVLALCAIAANPWPGSLIAFEEPENGVHPRRIELIAKLLTYLALERHQQVIVTTHSPLFCQQILAEQNKNPKEVAVLITRQENGQTVCEPFQTAGPLFDDHDIQEALTSRQEDGWFEGLVLRGLVDG